jgi:bifunctional non-homologous end joining protein LigD
VGRRSDCGEMAECRWLEPELVAQIKFVEWTEGDHLRDSKFMALRDDKDSKDVGRESEPDRSE